VDRPTVAVPQQRRKNSTFATLNTREIANQCKHVIDANSSHREKSLPADPARRFQADMRGHAGFVAESRQCITDKFNTGFH